MSAGSQRRADLLRRMTRSGLYLITDDRLYDDDLLARLDAAFDRELLALAAARVRERVAPQTWEAFRLTALDGLSGAAAAARIPMEVGQVYVAKRRVQKLLQEEIARLEEPPAAAAS